MKTDRVICFEVETIPAPKPVGPWNRQAIGVKRYKTYKEIIQFRANAVFPRPLEGPVQLSCHFFLPIPVSWSAAAIRRASIGQTPHITKPDLKNLIAGVEDALTGIAWGDDSQVIAYVLPSSKCYGMVPHTKIMCWGGALE